MKSKQIEVRNAKVHNLKSVSVNIPKESISVITGPSGSGKSSLAFDTIYVEGQRRYIESLSSYARQFLDKYQPPDVESITGLSPAIAIEQKGGSKNPRSTVGTITEIYDRLRILFSKVGTLYCPDSGAEIISYTPTKIANKLLNYPDKTRIHLLAPINATSEQMTSELSKLLSMGFTRLKVNDEIIQFDDSFTPPQNAKIQVVVDRIVIKENVRKRVIDSIEHALKIGEGSLSAIINDETLHFHEKNISPITGEKLPELSAKLFSFNSPIGACTECNGIGLTKAFEKEKLIFDPNFSLNDGAMGPILNEHPVLKKMVEIVLINNDCSMDQPFKDVPSEIKEELLEGTNNEHHFKFQCGKSKFDFRKKFPGIFSWLKEKYNASTSDRTKKNLEQYFSEQTCHICNGMKLNRVALSVKINDQNIMDLTKISIEALISFFTKIELTEFQLAIAEKLVKEINNRLKFLDDVGVGYLNLDRSARTLSGGENQRIRLATQIGTSLSGVLYVLDEPSIGLHPCDNSSLLKTLKALKELGNTILIVEHDEDTIRHADYIIDMGPYAGEAGGEILCVGDLDTIINSDKSITGKYLSRKLSIPMPKVRRESSKSISVKGATKNNIQDLSVELPLGIFSCITGVSGSGKSTLLHDIIVPAIRNRLRKNSRTKVSRCHYQSITGTENINSIVELDQSPIGKTPQSNPATYTGIFDEIRTIFSKTSESKIRGYKSGRFSFNIKGGRCEECEGNGLKKIEMHFLPDVFVTCDECNGSRYNRETLTILFKGKNISEILKMSIEEASDFFKNHPKINKVLQTMCDIGLGYMKLGQPATTLSGGEAQRLKLSKELAKRVQGHCIYVLDEPTTGLHFQDISLLLEALNRLVDQGHSVVVIEHNLDIMKNADHIIDLGPGGGNRGGKIVVSGTPEQVITNKNSLTSKFLRPYLQQ